MNCRPAGAENRSSYELPPRQVNSGGRFALTACADQPVETLDGALGRSLLGVDELLRGRAQALTFARIVEQPPYDRFQTVRIGYLQGSRFGCSVRVRRKMSRTICSSGACVLPAIHTTSAACTLRRLPRALVLGLPRSVVTPSYFTEPVTCTRSTRTPMTRKSWAYSSVCTAARSRCLKMGRKKLRKA